LPSISRPGLTVLVGILLYTAVLSWYSLGRAHNFNAGWYDLGIMSQTVWNVGHGHGFVFTNPEAGPGGVHGVTMARSAIHADYFLILLAPLSWFGSTSDNLLVAQSLVLAAGAWFVFSLTRRLTGRPWLGAFLAWVYLLYPPLQSANLFDFHSVTLAVTFFLAAADAILAKRHRLFWVWAGLALITKEQVGITLGLMAGALYWWSGERRRAIWALVVPWAWSIIQILVAIPLSRPGQSGNFILEKFYDVEGESPRTIIQTVLNPHRAWELLSTNTHLNAALQLAIPLGLLLPLLSPIVLLVLPEVLLYWLWDSPNPQTLLFHYHALFIPFLFLGLIFGWRNLQTLGRRWWPSGQKIINIIWILLVVGGATVAVVKYSPWPWSPQSQWRLIDWKERLTPQVEQALKMIPAKAEGVAITQNLGALINEHPTIQIVPNGLGQVNYVAILQRNFDANTKTDGRRRSEKVMLEQLIPYLQSSAAYRQLYHADRVWLFQRIGAVNEPEPTWPKNILGR